MSLSLALSGTLACGASTTQAPKSAQVSPDAVATPVPAEEFPKAAQLALQSRDRSAEAKLRLSGIVQHQLTRAHALFLQGHEKAAEDTTVGAMLLLRQDDALSAALAGQEEPLLLAAHAAARRGDSGRAAAFYQRVLALSASPETQTNVEKHLSAMANFRAATAGATELARAGEDVRHELSRATVEPSQAAYQSAQRATLHWMKLALSSDALSQSPESIAERDEALEAYHAIRTGAPALVALGLRQDEPLEVLEQLSAANMGRALPGGARGLLLEAGKKDDAEAWLNLFQLLDGSRRDESGDGNLPAYLEDAGTFWAALSLYRAQPDELKYAMPLSMMLLEFGMPEVATTVLSRAVGPDTSPEAMAWSLSLVLRAMLELGRTDQIEAARISFAEAQQLLKLAETKLPEDGDSTRSLHLMLANLEIRFGNTERALPLLAQASHQMARATTWLRLAEVKDQVEGPEQALLALSQATRAAQAQGDVLAEARIAEMEFLIERDRQNQPAAEQALERALQRALTARAMDLPQVPVTAVERVLGRILEDFGKQAAARRAYSRALDASRRNTDELSFTLTEMARSALTTGDVRLSRQATREALDLNVESSELIYIALWQSIVERRAGGHEDQMPRTALAEARDARGWVAQLRLFGLHQLSPDGLRTAAQTSVQKTEAEFYIALSANNEKAARAALQQVATSSAIDLVEVRIARDLLAPPLQFTWPEGVELP